MPQNDWKRNKIKNQPWRAPELGEWNLENLLDPQRGWGEEHLLIMLLLCLF